MPAEKQPSWFAQLRWARTSSARWLQLYCQRRRERIPLRTILKGAPDGKQSR